MSKRLLFYRTMFLYNEYIYIYIYIYIYLLDIDRFAILIHANDVIVAFEEELIVTLLLPPRPAIEVSSQVLSLLHALIA